MSQKESTTLVGLLCKRSFGKSREGESLFTMYPRFCFQPYLEPKELIENLQDGTNKPFITVEHGAINTVD